MRSSTAIAMLPIRWRPEARLQLSAITHDIARRNPAAADRLGAAIKHTVSQLPGHPHIYRPGRMEGTREAIVHPNYILVYRVGDAIEILSILHARQQYP
ncbi:type II toxin-antitoxin system RelE/ParE family toxin [Sphingomonas sp. HF-S4]|uniref:Type II toxin-antitoxin system RelE/ParE family toxin n=1 Tax=Sphingomonas agrestis TaxID=3080540 RepID=A0ABU3Y7F0_9SPHN|nr:type II toxin-antitoxin system RelE/ParE family toxin [Sphingomonas sp. HF-S4]MDV3457247.1 type II toxin-antitoxin system RelE/ParE family toxin [Sphingomonas sp. HF-S4]